MIGPHFKEIVERDKRSEWERRYITPTPFEKAWYSGATIDEAIAASIEAKKEAAK